MQHHKLRPRSIQNGSERHWKSNLVNIFMVVLAGRVPSETMIVSITIVDLVQKSVLSALHIIHSGPGNALFTKHPITSPPNLEKTLNNCAMKNVTTYSYWHL